MHRLGARDDRSLPEGISDARERDGGGEAANGAEPAPPRLPACVVLSCPSLLLGRLLPGWPLAAAALILRGGLADLMCVVRVKIFDLY